MVKRVISKNSAGWSLQVSEPWAAIVGEDEPDLLVEYLDEIRYPYRRRRKLFMFSPALRERDIVEVLQHFYSEIADVIVENPGTIS